MIKDKEVKDKHEEVRDKEAEVVQVQVQEVAHHLDQAHLAQEEVLQEELVVIRAQVALAAQEDLHLHLGEVHLLEAQEDPLHLQGGVLHPEAQEQVLQEELAVIRAQVAQAAQAAQEDLHLHPGVALLLEAQEVHPGEALHQEAQKELLLDTPEEVHLVVQEEVLLVVSEVVHLVAQEEDHLEVHPEVQGDLPALADVEALQTLRPDMELQLGQVQMDQVQMPHLEEVLKEIMKATKVHSEDQMVLVIMMAALLLLLILDMELQAVVVRDLLEQEVSLLLVNIPEMHVNLI